MTCRISSNLGFIKSWILYQLAEENSPQKESLLWTEEKMKAMVTSEPELALRTFGDILKLDSSDPICTCLANGPLHEFLVLHGNQFTKQLDELAHKNEKFKQLLSSACH